MQHLFTFKVITQEQIVVATTKNEQPVPNAMCIVCLGTDHRTISKHKKIKITKIVVFVTFDFMGTLLENTERYILLSNVFMYTGGLLNLLLVHILMLNIHIKKMMMV